jgi:hypothetical protein
VVADAGVTSVVMLRAMTMAIAALKVNLIARRIMVPSLEEWPVLAGTGSTSDFTRSILAAGGDSSGPNNDGRASTMWHLETDWR